MSAHTPGPWASIIDTKPPRSGPRMAMVRAGGSRAIDCTDSGGTWNETAANARLIAAAPTMYEYITIRAQAGDEEATRILESINGRS